MSIDGVGATLVARSVLLSFSRARVDQLIPSVFNPLSGTLALIHILWTSRSLSL